jgi:hypothetical protein
MIMAFFIIEKATGRKFSVMTPHRGVGTRRDCWGSRGAARVVMNQCNLHETHDLVPIDDYRPVMVKRKNLMSGKEYEEDINTPLCSSPASETYWSM